jgi:hypothetical protein
MFLMSARKARKETKEGYKDHIESSIRLAAKSGQHSTIIFNTLTDYMKKKLKRKGYKISETAAGTTIEW